MADTTIYSGTGGFPDIPETKLPGRPPFEFIEYPWFPEGLCLPLDPEVDLDVAPSARPIPTYTRPSLKPVVTVPTCEMAAVIPDCVSFSPMSTAAFTVNGRRYFGNNLMDKAWCTVFSMLNFDLNTAHQWRTEWTDPNEDIQQTIKQGGPYRLTVYGGKVIKHLSGNVTKTEHWPSGVTGQRAEMSPTMDSESSYNTIPANNTLSGFWNNLPTSPKTAVLSGHPAYTNGGYSGFGKVVPTETGEDGIVCRNFVYTGTLPAYVCYKFKSATPTVSAQATGSNEVEPTLSIMSTTSGDVDIDNGGDGGGGGGYTELLAVVGADGRIIQQKSSSIEEFWDPRPWQIFNFKDNYLIYLPDVTLWLRNSTKGTNDISLGSASEVPPFGEEGAWYSLGVTFDRKEEKASSKVSVWAKLKGDTGNYYAENPQWNLAECQVDGLTAGYDDEYISGIREEDAVLIGKIDEDGVVDQYMVGAIVQATKIPTDLAGQPWDIEFELLNCTITNPFYQTGPIVGEVALANDGKFTLGLAANAKTWIGALINTETMQGSFIFGENLSDIVDFPTSTPPFVKLPLYQVIALPTRNKEGVEDLQLSKTFDFRRLPQIPLYV